MGGGQNLSHVHGNVIRSRPERILHILSKKRKALIKVASG